MTSDVPQDNHIGPLLFIKFLNDIFGAKQYTFASDDVKLGPASLFWLRATGQDQKEGQRSEGPEGASWP